MLRLCALLFFQSSSTTSSSSQRTFTSTSSKHPLPARPDWAVGLKAQPTLSPGRRHDDNSRTMSPGRMGGNLPHIPYGQRTNQQISQQPPPPLQPTDFPPLSSAPEKRTPVIGGAWTNPSNVRSVLRAGPPTNTNGPSSTNALVHYSATQSPNMNVGNPNDNGNPLHLSHMGDQDCAYERPPPKSNAELFNPKGSRHRQSSVNSNGSNTAVSTELSTPDSLNVVSDNVGDATDALAYRVGDLRIEQVYSGSGNPDDGLSAPTSTSPSSEMHIMAS